MSNAMLEADACMISPRQAGSQCCHPFAGCSAALCNQNPHSCRPSIWEFAGTAMFLECHTVLLFLQPPAGHAHGPAQLPGRPVRPGWCCSAVAAAAGRHGPEGHTDLLCSMSDASGMLAACCPRMPKLQRAL